MRAGFGGHHVVMPVQVHGSVGFIDGHGTPVRHANTVVAAGIRLRCRGSAPPVPVCPRAAVNVPDSPDEQKQKNHSQDPNDPAATRIRMIPIHAAVSADCTPGRSAAEGEADSPGPKSANRKARSGCGRDEHDCHRGLQTCQIPYQVWLHCHVQILKL
jgi:hypothetical protein